MVFLFVLFCMLAGFAEAFWILSNNDPKDINGFGTVSQSFYNTFLTMLGQGQEFYFFGPDSPYVLTVLMVIFLILMMILMLNLLIAKMNDVFADVRDKGAASWRKEQTSIILEEKFLYKKLKIPKYLLVLKYSSEVKNNAIDYAKKLQEYTELSDCRPFSLVPNNDGDEPPIHVSKIRLEVRSLLFIFDSFSGINSF